MSSDLPSSSPSTLPTWSTCNPVLLARPPPQSARFWPTPHSPSGGPELCPRPTAVRPCPGWLHKIITILGIKKFTILCTLHRLKSGGWEIFVIFVFLSHLSIIFRVINHGNLGKISGFSRLRKEIALKIALWLHFPVAMHVLRSKIESTRRI